MARRRIHPIHTSIQTDTDITLYIPLDRERIVCKALGMLNEVGLKDLSMRKIADSLGVKAASLYYHVKDKEELLQLLADQISNRVEWPQETLAWDQQIIYWAQSFRKALHAFQDAVDVFHSSTARGYDRLRQIEALYNVFVQAGFDDVHIPWMSGMVKNYILSFVAEEVQLSSLAKRSGIPFEELCEQFTQTFKRLPQDQFPHLIRMASSTTTGDWETEFMFGLQVLLDGFKAKLVNPY
ncbi:TetR family transcriptional regulator [Paenibacillus sp. SYP-B3998]|uniref:TetR family transcriptional regulator n=1 Tax=Paenibacillus sp. SYP-B3998 TaxID=2678564 RepID=A0A6G3ZWQ3_9BACL|nr:TetR/AcrR family transcriptional regulator C-terminal domain-containing protein [Paenibacillus sp. SYP-B3998]NEW06643.1 TetR family transcriptional regulator [Paenibacillus sp. SYP-B3998]